MELPKNYIVLEETESGGRFIMNPMGKIFLFTIESNLSFSRRRYSMEQIRNMRHSGWHLVDGVWKK